MESYLRDFLKEDLTPTDLTANLVPNQYTEAKIYAKDSGILAGNHFALQTFKILGNVECRELISDGSKVDSGTEILHLQGDARVLLAGERLALNLIQRMSGIATLTRNFVGESVADSAN